MGGIMMSKHCKNCLSHLVCAIYNPNFDNYAPECHLYMGKDDYENIVRCRECKYWRDWQMAVTSHGFGPNMGECHCAQWDNEYFYYLTRDTDFCSYGEIEE
jgi:hypothetical protein